MLFHPRKPVLGLQGLLPRRQQALAKDIGRIIGTELVKTDDLLAPLDGIDLEPQLTALLDQAIAAKVADLRKIPLVGAFISDDLVAKLRNGLLKEFINAQPQIRAGMKTAIAAKLDIGAVAEKQLAAFELDRLENVVKQVASREFRAIEWWGAILGAVIGLLQAAVMTLL